MTSTTIKVPTELRDRLAEFAKRERTTLASALARCLDRAETAVFWEDVRATMTPADARAPVAQAAEQPVGTLRDGLDPGEDWTDVL